MVLARRTTTEHESLEDPANEWLSTHTLQDIRELAQELSEQGEDVRELVGAVNELEVLLAETKAENPAAGSKA